MKKISRFISLGLAAMTAFSMTACSTGGGAAAPTQGGQAAQPGKAPSAGAVTIKFSLSQAATEPAVLAANAFKEEVEE